MLDMNGESTIISELFHSPRAHRRSRSANSWTVTTPASVLPRDTNRFFADDDSLTSPEGSHTSNQRHTRPSCEHSSSSSRELSFGQKSSSPVVPSIASCYLASTVPSNLALSRRRFALLLAAAMSLCAMILWSNSGGSTSNHPKLSTSPLQISSPRNLLRGPGLSAAVTTPIDQPDDHSDGNTSSSSTGERRQQPAAAAAAKVEVKCGHREKGHELSATMRSAGLRVDRTECSRVLPTPLLESEGWLLAVHIDRASTTAPAYNRQLRGRDEVRRVMEGRHRDLLPHQYFVRVVEATLTAIADAEAGASVDIVIFSEGRAEGGLVDEVGMIVEWDVPLEVCQRLRLTCTQTTVSLHLSGSNPDALQCVAVADVLISSESSFSKAAAALSENVKIVTDAWEDDEDEQIVIISPLRTMSGAAMALGDRREFGRVIREYHDYGQ